MLRWATTRAGFDEHIISIHISYHISLWHMHTLYNGMYLHVFASRWSHHTIETKVLRMTLLPSPSNFKLIHWGKSEDMSQCGMCHLMFLLQQTGWTSIFVGLSVYNLRNFWSCCCWKGSFQRENWIKTCMKIYEFFRYTLQLQEFFQMFSPILTFKRGFGELLGPTCQIKVSWSHRDVSYRFVVVNAVESLVETMPFCHRLSWWLSRSWSLLVATWRSRLDMEHSGELGMLDQCDLHPKQLTWPVSMTL